MSLRVPGAAASPGEAGTTSRCGHGAALPPPAACRPHGSSFAPLAAGGLGPGRAPAPWTQKPFTGGIKAACVGTERRARPCPAAPSHLSGGEGRGAQQWACVRTGPGRTAHSLGVLGTPRPSHCPGLGWPFSWGPGPEARGFVAPRGLVGGAGTKGAHDLDAGPSGDSSFSGERVCDTGMSKSDACLVSRAPGWNACRQRLDSSPWWGCRGGKAARGRRCGGGGHP